MRSSQDQVPAEVLASFMASQPLARLVSLDPEGFPRLGLHPFAWVDGAWLLHLPHRHPQVSDLRARPQALVSLDEPLAFIPSHWVDPEDGGLATNYYQQASWRCGVEWLEGEAGLLRVLSALMARHQPEGGHLPLDPQALVYRGAFRALVGLRLVPLDMSLRFKHGQNRSPAQKEAIAARLRARGGAGDLKAAEALLAPWAQS